MAESKGGSAQGHDAEQQAAARKANNPEPLAGGAAPGAPETAGAAGARADDGSASIRATFTPAEHLGGSTYADPISAASGEWQMPAQDQLDEMALAAERARARSRGVPEDELASLEQNTTWVVSNMVDDRVVPGSFERDPRHPGGEAILGGSTPQRVFKTPTMERLLLGGYLVEVPPPQGVVEIEDPHSGQTVKVRNRKMPVAVMIDAGTINVTQPGRPTPIGRKLDEELWTQEQRRAVMARQRGMPAQIPVAPGGIVPRKEDVDRPA